MQPDSQGAPPDPLGKTPGVLAAIAIVIIVAASAVVLRTGAGGGATPSQTSATSGRSSPALATPTASPAPPVGSADSAAVQTKLAAATLVSTDGFHSASTSTGKAATTDPSLVQFITPSKNIGCVVGTGTITCGVRKATFPTPAKPATCAQTWTGGQLTLDATGVQQGACASTSQVPAVAAPLPYGSSVSWQGVSCVSNSDALSCLMPSTLHGFTVSRTDLTIF